MQTGVAAVVSLLALLAPTGRHALSLADTRKTIEQKGGKAALEILEPKWDALLAAIATGARGWLEVACQLKRDSDAEASETLAAAVAEAIAHAPSNVLRILDGSPFALDHVCGNGGFGALAIQGKADSAPLFNAQEAALLKVTSDMLAARRDTCLERIRRAKQAP